MTGLTVGAGAVAVASAFAAGLVNTLAGGGTNLTFPTLLWLGVGPIEASATSTVALWPGQTAGAWGYRGITRTLPRRWLWLLVPALLGGWAGGHLLILTPPSAFRSMVPFLVLASTVLLAVEPDLRRRLGDGEGRQAHRGWQAMAFLVVFAISIYGGYFGAGMGIMMLAALGLMRVGDLQQANGLKNLLGSAMNLSAVAWFAWNGTVDWPAAGLMVAGAIAGGYTGALLGSRIGERPLRMLMVALGVLVGLVLLLR